MVLSVCCFVFCLQVLAFQLAVSSVQSVQFSLIRLSDLINLFKILHENQSNLESN